MIKEISAVAVAGIVSFSSLLFYPNAYGQLPDKESRFPARNGASAIQGAYTNADSWEGRSVSVEGEIKSVLLQYGKPSFELQLDGDTDTTIWAMFPRPIGGGDEPKVGERLRAAGWIRKSETWESKIGSNLPRQNAMTLLANCLVSIPSLDAFVDPKFQQFCAAWQRGQSLPDMRR